VFTKTGSLFIMLLVGALARYRKIITTDALDTLCRLVLNVTLPALFIYILASKCVGNTILSLWYAPFFAAAIIFVGYGVATIAAKLLKVPKERLGTFKFLIAFQNSGFLAIPIAFALFGEDGVLNIVIFNIGFNLLLWTFGIRLLKGSKEKTAIKPFANVVNTGTVALALGLALGGFCIAVPLFIMDTAKMLGDATVPLSMLVVGAILAGSGIRSKGHGRELAVITLCRIIIIPVIFLGAIRIMPNIPTLMRSIIVLQAAMPSAVTSVIFAKRFGGDYDFAASGIFVTTLCSMVTVPIMMMFI